MHTKVLAIFFIIGVIFGPIYSLTLYNQYYSDPLIRNYPYYNENSNTTFLKENKVYLGQPSFGYGPTVTIVNHSVYAIIHPSQIATNYTFQNYADNGSLELLELNFSNDFNSILTSKNYLLPRFDANTSDLSQSELSRPIFYDNLFWAINYPQTSYPYPVRSSFISFNKQGVIYSNQSFNLTKILNITKPIFIDLEFVGIYQNYFIVAFTENKSLLLIPRDNFNQTRIISDQDILANNPGIILNPSFLNIDNNGLIWGMGQIHSRDFLLGLSLTDIMKNGTSNIKEIINQESNIPNVLINGTFDNISRSFSFSDYTFPIVGNGKIVSLNYLNFANGDGRIIYILAGVDINSLIKQEISSFDISVVFSGYLLFFSEGLIIIFQLRKEKKSNTLK